MNLESILKIIKQRLSEPENYNSQRSLLKSSWRDNMCEFKVILNGKEVWSDVIYAKADGNKVILRDVAGQSKEFKNCKIVEVDVNATKLVLAGA